MTRVALIVSIFALVIGGYATAFVKLLDNSADRPWLCEGLTAAECTAATQDFVKFDKNGGDYQH